MSMFLILYLSESGQIDFPEFLMLMTNLKLGQEDEEYLEAFNMMDTENKGKRLSLFYNIKFFFSPSLSS